MIWKGCFQLLIIFGIFALSLYTIYWLITKPQPSSEKEIEIYSIINDRLINHSSDELDNFYRLKSTNYPTNSVSSVNLNRTIERLSKDDVLAFLFHNYMRFEQNDISYKSNELKGLDQRHCSELCNLLAKEDPDREFSLICANLLKDSRSVNHSGFEDQFSVIHSFYNEGYFNDDQLGIALSNFSAGQTIGLLNEMNLLSDSGTFNNPDLSVIFKIFNPQKHFNRRIAV